MIRLRVRHSDKSVLVFFFSSRRRHTRCLSDWSSDVCSSDLTHNIGGGPGPMETRNSADFSGDSVVMVSPRGDSSVTQKMAVPKGTFPFQLHVYGLLELIGRWARAQGKDSVRFTALTSATATSGGYIVKRGGATLLISLEQ